MSSLKEVFKTALAKPNGGLLILLAWIPEKDFPNFTLKYLQWFRRKNTKINYGEISTISQVIARIWKEFLPNVKTDGATWKKPHAMPA